MIKCECGSDNVTTIDFKSNGRTAYERYKCRLCGHVWSETIEIGGAI